MIRKLLLITLFLVLITPILALELDFNKTKIGKNRIVTGDLILPEGSYDKYSIIKVSLDSEQKTKTIEQLLDCAGDCDQTQSNYYSYPFGAKTQDVTGTNFLTGIDLEQYSKINEEASFEISNDPNIAEFPDSPTIDIGNDGIIEWEFQGQAPTSPDWTVNSFYGPNMLVQPGELISPAGKCQNIFLNKSNEIRVRTCIKSQPSSTVVLNIFGKESESESCITPSPDYCAGINSEFITRECTLTYAEPLATAFHKVCLTASSDVILADNDTSLDPQGYHCGLSSCTPRNTDYIIQAKSSDFITELRSTKTYFESNTQSGDFFKDAVGIYLQSCTYDNNICVIPINISSRNNINVKVSGLSYIEELFNGDKRSKNKFLVGVKDEGSKAFYNFEGDSIIPLEEFEIETPNTLGDYILRVEYGAQAVTADIEVVPAPTSRFNVSSILEETQQPITFDASKSSGETDLTYKWDFGDNRTSTSKITTHVYTLPGDYTVRLTVKDENDIQDVKSLKLEIYSETATPQLIAGTLSRLEALKANYANANSDLKEIYTALDFENEIEKSITKLETASQITEAEVNGLLDQFPVTTNILNTVSVSPYLSQAQVNDLYGFESQAYRTTLQDLNSKFQKQVTARQVKLNYLTRQEDFILIEKTITVPETLTDVEIMEIIPSSLALTLSSLNFLDAYPEVTRLQNYQNAKFTIPSLREEFTIRYTVDSTNLAAVKDTLTVVIPQDLSPAQVPFNCGDNICNPAEDSISCPEDCHCGNNLCESGENEYSCPLDCKQFPWMITIILVLLASGTAVAVLKFQLHKKLKLDDLFSLIGSKFKKSPFPSGVEMGKVRNYVKSALEKGYDKEKIISTLTEKGWSKSQVEYAFRKLKKKKKKS